MPRRGHLIENLYQVCYNAYEFICKHKDVKNMDFYILLAILSILAGLWNIAIGILGLFPKFHRTAVATLKKADTQRNVQAKGNRIIPILTKYTYIYSVNGRKYKYTAQNYRDKRHLFSKAIMVYIKWFPHRAYPNKFAGTLEWLIGISLLFLGILILIIAIIY